MLEKVKNLDAVLILAVMGLLALGLVALYSTSQSLLKSGSSANFFQMQLQWILLGVFLMLVVAYLPSQWIPEYSYWAYGISIILLILVFFIGYKGYGATRWIRLGSIRFQPSEFAKIFTILAVGRYLSSERVNINEIKHFLIASALIVFPFVLIARQPDLGTALVFLMFILPIFYWAGLSTKNLIMITTPALVLIASFNEYAFSAIMVLIVAYLIFTRWGFLKGLLYFAINALMGLVTPALWNQLQDYQKRRILVFLNPEADPLNAGYQIIQSKVAIGSGGLMGKGFLQGSQTQLRFLPEQHTDFIFAVIGEEFGFIGVMAGIVLFTILLIRIIQLAANFRNKFYSVVSIGIAINIAFHMFVNVGMTIGLFPVTGLPLPFLSYGGSALLSNLMMIGLLLNFYRNRYEY